MKIILLSTLFTSLITYTLANGINISVHDLNSKLLLPFNHPNIKALTSVTYGEVDPNITVQSPSTLTEDESACVNEEVEYLDCLKGANSVDSCKDLFNGKCKPFFSDPLSVLPSCKKIDKVQQNYLVHSIQCTATTIKLECTSNGECPVLKDMELFAANSQNNNSGAKEAIYIPNEDVLMDNCKSAECTDKTIEFFEELIKFNEAAVDILKDAIEKKTVSENLLNENIDLIQEQNDGIKHSIEISKNCKSSSGDTFNISKSVSTIVVDSLLVATFLFLFIRN